MDRLGCVGMGGAVIFIGETLDQDDTLVVAIVTLWRGDRRGSPQTTPHRVMQ
jgi:hypothetical protein